MGADEFILFVDRLPADFVLEKNNNRVVFLIPPQKTVCPQCGNGHLYVHQFRKQTIQGIPGNTTYIYKKRRYICSECRKTFFEKNPFIGERQKKIATPLKKRRGDMGISISEMARKLDIPQYAYQWLEDGKLPKGSRYDRFPPPSIETAEKAARIVGLTIDEAFESREAIEKRIFDAEADYVEKIQKREEERIRKRGVRKEAERLRDVISQLPIEEQQKLLKSFGRQADYTANTKIGHGAE